MSRVRSPMRTPIVALVPAAIAACVCALVLAWGAGSARAQRIYDPTNIPRAHFTAPLAPYPQSSWRAKDFSIIRRGNWYHLFYTRVHRYTPAHYKNGAVTILNETSIGHAMSTDLETWFPLDTLLTVRPGKWDAHHVWAPSVVERNGVYWMFYTGVTDQQGSSAPDDWYPRWQAIGVAYSTDPLLLSWTRVDQPIWAPCPGNGLPGVPWAVCNPIFPRGSADFRDAYVQPPSAGDPPGTPWLMYYTARVASDQFNYVVGVARSATDPPGTWSDVGALWDTYVPASNSKIESPHVFKRGDTWHLFYTGDDGTTGIVQQTSLSPATGPWEAEGPIVPRFKDVEDVPYPFTLEPEFWFASEYLGEDSPAGHADYFCVVHAYAPPPQYAPPGDPPIAPPEPVSIVEFRQMLWNSDGSFQLVAPSPVRVLELTTDVARVGDRISLVLDVEAAEGRTAALDVVWVNGGVEVPIAPAVVGLPATVPLVEGQTIVPWLVVSPRSALPVEVRVRVASQPLRASTSLTIVAPEGGGGEVVGRDLPVRQAIVRMERVLTPSLTVREIGSTPLGAGRGLLIEVTDACTARIAIYDVRGRLMRTLGERMLERGANIETWDGRDGAGRAVPGGMYFARVATPSAQAYARFVVLP
jgi:hypothetical protein